MWVFCLKQHLWFVPSSLGYGLEVDMWAAGVILYILLCGFPPFRSQDRDQEELFQIIQLGHYEFLSPYWDNISAGKILHLEQIWEVAVFFPEVGKTLFSGEWAWSAWGVLRVSLVWIYALNVNLVLWYYRWICFCILVLNALMESSIPPFLGESKDFPHLVYMSLQKKVPK